MITKNQALNLKHGQTIKQVKAFNGQEKVTMSGQWLFVSDGTTRDLEKPVNWRINGKVQVWKTRPNDFKVPIKHGLYNYGYLDHTNNHLFELEG